MPILKDDWHFLKSNGSKQYEKKKNYNFRVKAIDTANKSSFSPIHVVCLWYTNAKNKLKRLTFKQNTLLSEYKRVRLSASVTMLIYFDKIKIIR